MTFKSFFAVWNFSVGVISGDNHATTGLTGPHGINIGKRIDCNRRGWYNGMVIAFFEKKVCGQAAYKKCNLLTKKKGVKHVQKTV